MRYPPPSGMPVGATHCSALECACCSLFWRGVSFLPRAAIRRVRGVPESASLAPVAGSTGTILPRPSSWRWSARGRGPGQVPGPLRAGGAWVVGPLPPTPGAGYISRGTPGTTPPVRGGLTLPAAPSPKQGAAVEEVPRGTAGPTFRTGLPPYRGEYQGGRCDPSHGPTGLPPTAGERLDTRGGHTRAPLLLLAPQPSSPSAQVRLGTGLTGARPRRSWPGHPRLTPRPCILSSGRLPIKLYRQSHPGRRPHGPWPRWRNLVPSSLHPRLTAATLLSYAWAPA